MSRFSPETFRFLDELSFNNNREWFNANKPRYEDHVREPARELVRQMSPQLARLSAHFLADDRKVGGALMRIYRDTRFSKDKTPYKTNIGLHFRHDAGKDVHAPGVYVHVETDELFVGVGMWLPPNPVLNQVRRAIDAQQPRWSKIIADIRKDGRFEQGGTSLKRPPRGFDKDHPLVDELRRKSHLLTAKVGIDRVLADDFAKWVGETITPTKAYLAFLCEAIGVAF